jgi:hypothetical protein
MKQSIHHSKFDYVNIQSAEITLPKENDKNVFPYAAHIY